MKLGEIKYDCLFASVTFGLFTFDSYEGDFDRWHVNYVVCKCKLYMMTDEGFYVNVLHFNTNLQFILDGYISRNRSWFFHWMRVLKRIPRGKRRKRRLQHPITMIGTCFKWQNEYYWRLSVFRGIVRLHLRSSEFEYGMAGLVLYDSVQSSFAMVDESRERHQLFIRRLTLGAFQYMQLHSHGKITRKRADNRWLNSLNDGNINAWRTKKSLIECEPKKAAIATRQKWWY